MSLQRYLLKQSTTRCFYCFLLSILFALAYRLNTRDSIPHAPFQVLPAAVQRLVEPSITPGLSGPPFSTNTKKLTMPFPRFHFPSFSRSSDRNDDIMTRDGRSSSRHGSGASGRITPDRRDAAAALLQMSRGSPPRSTQARPRPTTAGYGGSSHHSRHPSHAPFTSRRSMGPSPETRQDLQGSFSYHRSMAPPTPTRISPPPRSNYQTRRGEAPSTYPGVPSSMTGVFQTRRGEIPPTSTHGPPPCRHASTSRGNMAPSSSAQPTAFPRNARGYPTIGGLRLRPPALGNADSSSGSMPPPTSTRPSSRAFPSSSSQQGMARPTSTRTFTSDAPPPHSSRRSMAPTPTRPQGYQPFSSSHYVPTSSGNPYSHAPVPTSSRRSMAPQLTRPSPYASQLFSTRGSMAPTSSTNPYSRPSSSHVPPFVSSRSVGPSVHGVRPPLVSPSLVRPPLTRGK